MSGGCCHRAGDGSGAFRVVTSDEPFTILLVEDEETVRETMAEFLEMRGFTVLTAENGRLAIDLYQKLPDCIFIKKPFNMHQLVGKSHELLRKRPFSS